jgi:hypothetical protein
MINKDCYLGQPHLVLHLEAERARELERWEELRWEVNHMYEMSRIAQETWEECEAAHEKRSKEQSDLFLIFVACFVLTTLILLIA